MTILSPLGWEVYTLIDAYKPRPPVKYAIAGLFVLPSVNVIYGPPGSLKSFLMADACLCVATGNPWLENATDFGQFLETRQMPALWLDFDNGKRRTHERFDALGTARTVPPTMPLYYVSMPIKWLDLTKAGQVQELIAAMKLLKIGFLCIDNLGVVSGNADENTTEMIQVMSNLRVVAEQTGATVNMIHHQRKTIGSTSRRGDTLRGHSSIEASLDLALRIEREANSATIKIEATKARGYDVQPLGAVFSYKHKPNTTELAEARFWGLEIEDRTSDYAIAQAIIEALETNGPMIQKDLLAETKSELDIGINRIRGKLAEMVLAREVLCHIQAGRGHAREYSLP